MSHFVCQVSGGGLMAGHALAVADGFPAASVIGVEPTEANDFQLSLQAGERVRLEMPTSICDGLLSYDVGEHNWPLLKEHVTSTVLVPDEETKKAMLCTFCRVWKKTNPHARLRRNRRMYSRARLHHIYLSFPPPSSFLFPPSSRLFPVPPLP